VSDAVQRQLLRATGGDVQLAIGAYFQNVSIAFSKRQHPMAILFLHVQYLGV